MDISLNEFIDELTVSNPNDILNNMIGLGLVDTSFPVTTDAVLEKVQMAGAGMSKDQFLNLVQSVFDVRTVHFMNDSFRKTWVLSKEGMAMSDVARDLFEESMNMNTFGVDSEKRIRQGQNVPWHSYAILTFAVIGFSVVVAAFFNFIKKNI